MKVPEPRKLASGKWFIQLRLGGKSIPVTASTKKECTRSAELIKAEYRTGKKDTPPPAKIVPTLRDAMTAYIDNKRNILSPSTLRGYNSILNTRYQDVIDKAIDKIDWQAMVNADAEKRKGKTVKNGWRFTCSVLREAGFTPPKVALPQIVQDEHPYLEPSQIKPFVTAIKDDPCRIPALLGLHSLRRSEMLALTWDDIDLKDGLIFVRGSAVFDSDNHLVQKTTNKNTSSRRVIPIMIPDLLDALKSVDASQRTGPVVTVNPNTIYAQVNRICRKNGFPEIGVHGLRHSFASLAFSSDVGMTEREVMEIGGWADSQTVHKIYEHLAKRNRLKATNRMAEFFKNANENANENSEP